MTEIEMTPKWWKYAAQCAAIARRSISRMHEDEREHHNITVEDCKETIRRINEKAREDGVAQYRTDVNWIVIDLTDTDLEVIYQGLVDRHFQERERVGGDWDDVEHSSEYHAVENTIREAMP